MNYRHAFHAGNFADVMKHALLARILVHLRKKAAPFRVIDTHAGTGWYDLAGEEAGRTGEAAGGIGRLEAPFRPDVEALLQPYRAVLTETRRRHGDAAYPGSPEIVRQQLRPDDRAIFCERHPADGSRLAERFAGSGRMKVLVGDGWAALAGLIPPKERRGLVLIDPPYEEPDEMAEAPARLARALRRWPTGIFALWYPIKDEVAATRLAAATTALAGPFLRLELAVEPTNGERLTGSGVAVLNPPWLLQEEAASLLAALAERLARNGAGAVLCEMATGK